MICNIYKLFVCEPVIKVAILRNLNHLSLSITFTWWLYPWLSYVRWTEVIHSDHGNRFRDCNHKVHFMKPFIEGWGPCYRIILLVINFDGSKKSKDKQKKCRSKHHTGPKVLFRFDVTKPFQLFFIKRLQI